MMTFLYWYLVLGFVLAVVGDGYNAIVEWRNKAPNPDSRFYLADTVFVTVAWPVVLWVVAREAKRG